jgi:hypothetical protein
MSREQERLDRLMGLLASERGGGRDLRGSVMARLSRGGVFIRRARWMRRSALAAVLLVGTWLGFDAWRASAVRTDLGGVGRRGADWIVPDAMPGRVVPVRGRAPARREPNHAFAPWGRT